MKIVSVVGARPDGHAAERIVAVLRQKVPAS